MPIIAAALLHAAIGCHILDTIAIKEQRQVVGLLNTDARKTRAYTLFSSSLFANSFLLSRMEDIVRVFLHFAENCPLVSVTDTNVAMHWLG